MANTSTHWRHFKAWIKRCFSDIYKWLLIIRWIMMASCFVGLALACWADKIGKWWPWSNIMSHFGEALVIASIIGFFLEITEVKTFFEERLTNVLFGGSYIGSVNRDRLITLSEIALKGIGQIHVNNKLHDYDSFVTSIIEDVALENIDKVYRKDFNETIYYSALNPNESGNNTSLVA